jgi:hypothetical protein
MEDAEIMLVGIVKENAKDYNIVIRLRQRFSAEQSLYGAFRYLK